jgi:hypothetical protein
VVKRIIAKYAEKDIALARVWFRSWKARGWRTGVRLGGSGISFRVINFGLARRGAPEKNKSKKLGARGWLTSPLVKFPPGSTEDDVLNCGREL